MGKGGREREGGEEGKGREGGGREGREGGREGPQYIRFHLRV